MLVVVDVSQYQGDIDWPTFVAYLRSTYGAAVVIVRAGYGLTIDAKWERNITAALGQADLVGAYWYLTKATDAAAQAHAFIGALGGRRVAVTGLDLEEGDGDQQPRQHAFLEVMTTDPATDWTYSGEWFVTAHNLDGVQWVARYANSAPAIPYELWQNSSTYSFPGIAGNVDGSVFNGTLDDLRALWNQGVQDMPITDDDAIKIAQAVASYEHNADPKYGGGVALEPNAQQALARIDAGVATLLGAKSTDASAIASALVTALPADLAKQVADELAKRLSNG